MRYVWRVWHALQLEDPLEPFRMKVIEFPCDPGEFGWLAGGRLAEGGRIHG
ncbi:MAG: hypothetical protein AB1609_13015 [Bacillota bacterium]